jgi:hypothetical protein
MRFNVYHDSICDLLKIEDADERRKLRVRCMRLFHRGFTLNAACAIIRIEIEAAKPPTEPPLP